MSYYTLADPAPAVGSALGMPDNGTYVTDDPRALSMLYIFDGEPDHESAADLVLNTNIVLVRLEPAGDVEQDGDNPHLFAAPGWTVTGIEPTDAVLGPQAPHIRRITAMAEDELTWFGPRSDAYVEAVNARYDDTQPYVAAAEAALEAIGADGLEWTGCAYGWELLALAARDLIGTTPEWTQQAYDALTEPWRLVMHAQAHPDDTAPAPAPETR